MRRGHRFPETPVGGFPEPPTTFSDGAGREIDIHLAEGSDAEWDALVAMYVDFDPADRAQGIPPSSESRIERWVEDLLARGVNVLASHDDVVAGHAVLVPDDGEGHELAIFVHQDYQGAGIGTELIRALLGAGASRGIERVWLTVERWNRAAVSLYETVGFETTSAESFELEMGLRLE